MNQFVGQLMTNKDINYHSGLNSVWTKNLANNQQPDGKALLDHLKTIHQHNAGFTEKCASTCRDRYGRNSYEWLAEAVPDINGTLEYWILPAGQDHY